MRFKGRLSGFLFAEFGWKFSKVFEFFANFFIKIHIFSHSSTQKIHAIFANFCLWQNAWIFGRILREFAKKIRAIFVNFLCFKNAWLFSKKYQFRHFEPFAKRRRIHKFKAFCHKNSWIVSHILQMLAMTNSRVNLPKIIKFQHFFIKKRLKIQAFFTPNFQPLFS